MVPVGTGSVGLVGCLSDDLVGHDSGGRFWGPSLWEMYSPEWNTKGSLFLSSASSKKARSGFTAFRRFDQRGTFLPFKTAYLLIDDYLLDLYKLKRPYPAIPAATLENIPATGRECPFKVTKGSDIFLVA